MLWQKKLHARRIGQGRNIREKARQASPREIVSLILHANIYLIEEEIKKYTHIHIRDYMGLRGHGCGGERIFYLGQTRCLGAHQDERSKETYHVYVYTRPPRCHTRTQ